MNRFFSLIALLGLTAACAASDLPTPIAPRTILLQYAGRPTAADSLAVSQIGGAPATVYPIIHSIAVRTSAPTSAFSGLSRKPEVDDVDSLDRSCGGFGLLVFTDLPASAADSAVLVSIGANLIDYFDPNHISADFHHTKLDPVLSATYRLADDPNIVTADLELGCLTPLIRSR